MHKTFLHWERDVLTTLGKHTLSCRDRQVKGVLFVGGGSWGEGVSFQADGLGWRGCFPFQQVLHYSLNV